MDWITQNGGTLIVGIVLLALVGAILYCMHKDKKAGKSSCGCSCSHCPMSGSCHGGKQDSEKK